MPLATGGAGVGIVAAVVIVAAVAVAAMGGLYVFSLGLVRSARAAGVPLRTADVVAMRLRGVPPAPVVQALILADTSGLGVSLPQLEAHALAGGDGIGVLNAMLAARRDGDALTFAEAAALDLAAAVDPDTRDALRALMTRAKPGARG